MIPTDRWAGLGPATIIQGDARQLPLPDHSVDLVVTSPPYFALRSYTDAGGHYGGQIGSEPTPAEFIDALLECTAEMVRVLKPSGSIFVNLGDKYSQRVALRPSSHQDGLFPDRPELTKDWKRDRAAGLARMPYENIIDGSGRYVPEKSLMGLPWRYALACIDRLGLILRAEIIWSKPNGLPESVTDRVRRSHEQWFHFVVQPRYYSAVDEIREPYDAATAKRYAAGYNARAFDSHRPTVNTKLGNQQYDENPLGKLPGSVREVPSVPLVVPPHLGVDHFAAFPPAWPAWIIRGWSPAGVCVDCGEGRRPVVMKEQDVLDCYPSRRGRIDLADNGSGRSAASAYVNPEGRTRSRETATITGYACACPEPTADTTPARILDPFGGTGTTAMAARAHGRHAISIDLSHDYARLARWRCQDPDQLAAARGLPRGGRTTDDEPTLLDLLTENEEAS